MNVPATVSAGIQWGEITRVLKFIREHPSRQGNKAKKAFVRMLVITLAIIAFIMCPLSFYTFSYTKSPHMPENAVRQIRGHISQYNDTFWYTENSQKFEFDRADYPDSQGYDNGEIVYLYFDAENHIIGFSDGKAQSRENMTLWIALYAVPIFLLLAHALLGRKFYCRDWFLYLNWYRREIEPHLFSPDYSELVAHKEYRNVFKDPKEMAPAERKTYRWLLLKMTVLGLSLIPFTALMIYLCITVNVSNDMIAFEGAILAYVLFVYLLSRRYERKLEQIRYIDAAPIASAPYYNR